MTRQTIAAVLLLPACVVYDYPNQPGTPVVVPNSAPYIDYAASYVGWDPYYGDDIWSFEIGVNDPDGVYDVQYAWADVYDEWYGGALVESFDMAPSNDPTFWYSDWFGSSTYLDPFWGGYTVDLIACDSFDVCTVATVIPDTY